MPKQIEEVMAETMQLNLEDRAQLAGKLLLSLDEPTESEVERLWLDEAERRLADFRQDKVKVAPADDVFRRATDELS